MRSFRVLTVAVAALLCSGVTGTQAQEPAGSTVSEILVFGDVANSGLFRAESPPTVSDFIERIGGLTSGSASVRVVRDGAVVSATLVEPGKPADFRVQHGDTLVVHALDRLSGQQSDKFDTIEVVVFKYRKTRPLIVTLSAGSVTTREVLARVEMQGLPFRVLRTHPKAPPVAPGQDSTLMHGDIVIVEDGEPVVTAASTAGETPQVILPASDALAHPPRLTIPVSERTVTDSPVPAVADYGAVDAAPQSEFPAASQGVAGNEFEPGVSRTMNAGAALQSSVPAVQASATPRDLLNVDPWAVPVSQPPVGNPGAGGQLANPVPPPIGGQAYGNAGMPPAGMSAGTAQYGHPNSGAPGGVAMRPDAFGALTANPAAAPTPPGQEPAAASQSAGSIPLPGELDAQTAGGAVSTLWYVAGLVGALLIVLGAWVYGSRALAERPQLNSPDQYKRPVSRKHSSTVKQQPVGDRSTDQSAGIRSSSSRNKPPTPTIKPIVAQRPVSESAAPTFVPPAPVQHGATSPAVTMATGQSSQSPQDATVVIAQPASIQPVATFSPVAEPGSAPAQAAPQSPTPEPIPVPDTATTRILDALVSNSLPVVEDTVQLPTHLEFFGDSQGPRRLRIDPAQPALRGPHTAVRSSVARNSAAEESLQ